jgi:lipoate-protein ligase A
MVLERVRFIPFAARSPYENMAFDEFLLDDFLENGIPYFRLYAWRPAGLSIGVNQSLVTVDTDKCKEDHIPVVRRITGGGAILHADELTYSLVFPIEAFGKGSDIKESFETVTAFIMEMYRLFGLDPMYAKDAYPDRKHGEKSAFCFSSSEEYDITINGKKIGGNAQARRKTAVFQHGSIPLEESFGNKYVIEDNSLCDYTSLGELLGRTIDVSEAAAKCLESFEKIFGVRVEDYTLTLDDKKKIVKLMTSKYANAQWNFNGKI